jgi:hypothetical protein
MFSLFRYIFSLSITSASDDVLMIKPTIYFFIPENKIHESGKMGQNVSSPSLHEWCILGLLVPAVPLVPLDTFIAVYNNLCEIFNPYQSNLIPLWLSAGPFKCHWAM